MKATVRAVVCQIRISARTREMSVKHPECPSLPGTAAIGSTMSNTALAAGIRGGIPQNPGSETASAVVVHGEFKRVGPLTDGINLIHTFLPYPRVENVLREYVTLQQVVLIGFHGQQRFTQ